MCSCGAGWARAQILNKKASVVGVGLADTSVSLFREASVVGVGSPDPSVLLHHSLFSPPCLEGTFGSASPSRFSGAGWAYIYASKKRASVIDVGSADTSVSLLYLDEVVTVSRGHAWRCLAFASQRCRPGIHYQHQGRASVIGVGLADTSVSLLHLCVSSLCLEGTFGSALSVRFCGAGWANF